MGTSLAIIEEPALEMSFSEDYDVRLDTIVQTLGIGPSAELTRVTSLRMRIADPTIASIKLSGVYDWIEANENSHHPIRARIEEPNGQDAIVTSVLRGKPVFTFFDATGTRLHVAGDKLETISGEVALRYEARSDGTIVSTESIPIAYQAVRPFTLLIDGPQTNSRISTLEDRVAAWGRVASGIRYVYVFVEKPGSVGLEFIGPAVVTTDDRWETTVSLESKEKYWSGVFRIVAVGSRSVWQFDGSRPMWADQIPRGKGFSVRSVSLYRGYPGH